MCNRQYYLFVAVHKRLSFVRLSLRVSMQMIFRLVSGTINLIDDPVRLFGTAGCDWYRNEVLVYD